MNRILVFFATLVFTTVFITTTAHASPVETPPWVWRKGSFGISSTSEYFSSKANYDTSRGQFTRLNGNNSLTDFNTYLRGRYAFWPRFSMYVGAGLAQVRALDGVNEKTNSGLTQAYLGGHFTVWRDWLLMVAEIEAGMPLDAGGPMKKFDRYSTTPMIDDGAYYGRAILHMRRDIKSFRLFGHVGAKIPTEGLSKTFIYGVYGELPIGEYLMVGGGVDGEETIMNDELNYADRNQVALLADAGSSRFRTFDPSILRGRGWLGFRPGQTVEIRAGYMQTITGQRAAAGQAFTLSLAFNSIPVRRARSRFESGDRISAPGNSGPFRLDSEKMDPDVIAPKNDFEPQRGDDLNETERLFN